MPSKGDGILKPPRTYGPTGKELDFALANPLHETSILTMRRLEKTLQHDWRGGPEGTYDMVRESYIELAKLASERAALAKNSREKYDAVEAFLFPATAADRLTAKNWIARVRNAEIKDENGKFLADQLERLLELNQKSARYVKDTGTTISELLVRVHASPNRLTKYISRNFNSLYSYFIKKNRADLITAMEHPLEKSSAATVKAYLQKDRIFRQSELKQLQELFPKLVEFAHIKGIQSSEKRLEAAKMHSAILNPSNPKAESYINKLRKDMTSRGENLDDIEFQINFNMRFQKVKSDIEKSLSAVSS